MRPTDQPTAHMFANVDAHALSVPSVPDGIPVQPSSSAANLFPDSPSSLTPDRRPQLQGLRPAPSGPCPSVPVGVGNRTQDPRLARMPSAAEGPSQWLPCSGLGCGRPPVHGEARRRNSPGPCPPDFRPTQTCVQVLFGWTSRRNRISHGLRSTRPTVAPPVPDGGRVTGPDGPGRGPGRFLLPRPPLRTVRSGVTGSPGVSRTVPIPWAVIPGHGNPGLCTGPSFGRTTRILPAPFPGVAPAPMFPDGKLDASVLVLRIPGRVPLSPVWQPPWSAHRLWLIQPRLVRGQSVQ